MLYCQISKPIVGSPAYSKRLNGGPVCIAPPPKDAPIPPPGALSPPDRTSAPSPSPSCSAPVVFGTRFVRRPPLSLRQSGSSFSPARSSREKKKSPKSEVTEERGDPTLPGVGVGIGTPGIEGDRSFRQGFVRTATPAGPQANRKRDERGRAAGCTSPLSLPR